VQKNVFGGEKTWEHSRHESHYRANAGEREQHGGKKKKLEKELGGLAEPKVLLKGSYYGEGPRWEEECV